jgi:glucosamine--fructose-6-phosphate aminotransferase (isomerizing)
MCGIFGYTGPQQAGPLILDGLRHLEYRGYDSAGLAVFDSSGRFQLRKVSGKLDGLAEALGKEPTLGTHGIGHTRWATHGEPSEANAHPHTDDRDLVAVAHNGIVENYIELRRRLIDAGHAFSSETDSEVIPHLVRHHIDAGNGLVDAVRHAASELRGAHSIAVMSVIDPGVIVVARVGNAGGIAVGIGDGESFIASDLPALVPHTTSVVFLAPGEVAEVRAGRVELFDLAGSPLPVHRIAVAADAVTAAKGGYKHFMLKEILEQPEVAISALRGRISFEPGSVSLTEVPLTDAEIRSISRVVLVGMGTSLYAAQLGALYIERLARIPATAEDASEFRYRDPVATDTLVVAVVQSGETADTLEAMHAASSSGARLLAVVNVAGSQATRVAEGTLMMHAGLEVGVASSKTFTSSLVCLLLLAAHLGSRRGALDASAMSGLASSLAQLPVLLGSAIQANNAQCAVLAAKYGKTKRLLFIGRGLLVPIASEGAMKLKEISYIHAEGMTAAMMKHGPIALVDPETPVMALATRHAMRDKIIGNINEVLARGGPVLAVATQGDEGIAALADDVLWVPPAPPLLEPMVATIPLQLLAYHVAEYIGADVDQPRNLAKSVTVE